jgi:uncharacterized protein YcfJ
MNSILRNALAVAGLAFATQAAANITFYEREGFEGRSFSTAKQLGNFERAGFNDRASSAVVSRGERWEVCDDARFSGNCVVLRPGQYPSLSAMGLNNSISSTRLVNRNARFDDNRFAPAPLVQEDYRRRGQERIYEAEVTAVRAVLGAPEQRCWVEREEFARERGNANVPAAIAGAVIGGILGHQVGGGRGQDVATAGGAVAGAAIGSNVGRSGGSSGYSQNVQRCETVPNQGAPAYYDVTYNFRGQEHRVQMAVAPGRTVRVNAQGEPRA